MLALSLRESPSASAMRGRRQLWNGWFIKVRKNRGEMMESLLFPAHPLDFYSRGTSSANFKRYVNIFPKHIKWTDWGCPAKHNLGLYFSPNCSIKAAYVFIVLHQGTNTWALFSPRVFILIPWGDSEYPEWRIVFIT